jgi:hypothetical protein
VPRCRGGGDHVNGQPRKYRIGKFLDNGFRIGETTTAKIGEAFEKRGSVVIFYRKNTLVFPRA